MQRRQSQGAGEAGISDGSDRQSVVAMCPGTPAAETGCNETESNLTRSTLRLVSWIDDVASRQAHLTCTDGSLSGHAFIRVDAVCRYLTERHRLTCRNLGVI
jgi:hypothetical protein